MKLAMSLAILSRAYEKPSNKHVTGKQLSVFLRPRRCRLKFQQQHRLGPVSGGFNKQQSEARTHVQNYETDLLGIYLRLSSSLRKPSFVAGLFS